eukprot:6197705-Pleurochrysis_carterae.AAC.1
MRAQLHTYQAPTMRPFMCTSYRLTGECLASPSGAVARLLLGDRRQTADVELLVAVHVLNNRCDRLSRRAELCVVWHSVTRKHVDHSLITWVGCMRGKLSGGECARDVGNLQEDALCFKNTSSCNLSAT